MNGWKKGILGDFITLQRGFDLPEYERHSGEVPVVTSSGISGFHNEAKVKAPGVVMGRYGTIGSIYFIKENFWPHNTTLYVKDFKNNDPHFVSYFLRTINYQAHNDKSSVPGLNRNHLHLIPVIFPTIPEQIAIAGILGVLDDKIELNRRMNATIESLVRAAFHQWFVVNDEAKGWKKQKWGDIAILEYGKSLSDYKFTDAPYVVYGTNGPIGRHKEVLSQSEGIIVGRKGAYRGIHYSPEPFFVIDTAFYLKPRKPFSMKWAYYELLRVDLNSMDSGSAIPSTSRTDFYNLPVLFPSQKFMIAFDDFAASLFSKIYANEKESLTLASLRDNLLPKLISGEVSLKDVEELL